MIRVFVFITALCCPVTTILFSGCSRNPTPHLTPVEGKLTFNSEPLKDGNVSFWKEDMSNTFSGPIVDGQYTIGNEETGWGAEPGTYIVSINSWKVLPEEAPGGIGIPAVPMKFTRPQTSGLKVDVPQEPDGVTLDLELVDETAPPSN